MSAATTPTSTTSPASIALAPATTDMAATAPTKALSLAPSAVSPQATHTITTTREWVVPPRPKPGRKPATDTPPTKRKAQNRAAQRAFRERRAARVGELEEQLEEIRDEHRRREKALHDKVSCLDAEISRLNGDLEAWKLRCETLDRIADYERKQREATLVELSYLRRGAQTTGTEAVQLPPRRSHVRPPVADSMPSPEGTEKYASPPDETLVGCGNCKASGPCICMEVAVTVASGSCGRCTADSRCQCLEDSLPNLDHDTTRRSPSPDPLPRASVDPEMMEIDFTAQFSKKGFAETHAAHEAVVAPVHMPHHVADPCGFCEDGTYCVCAEAAAAAASARSAPGLAGTSGGVNRLAFLLNEVTPPPSDADADMSQVKLPSISQLQMHRSAAAGASSASSSEGCGGGGPGTCKQCLSDPMSGLFCRSLAALRQSGSSSSSRPDGCCGGGSAGGCCRRDAPAPAPPASSSSSLMPPPSLSCADAYKTLSTHKNFDQASDELNIWLGKLQATPAQHEGRAPMEVEAASVMGVLKLFDRRFGRG